MSKEKGSTYIIQPDATTGDTSFVVRFADPFRDQSQSPLARAAVRIGDERQVIEIVAMSVTAEDPAFVAGVAGEIALEFGLDNPNVRHLLELEGVPQHVGVLALNGGDKPVYRELLAA